MQPVISIEKLQVKNAKSSTIYPKKHSTCIVAVTVNENMKTPNTEISNETGLCNSVTQSTSTSTCTIIYSKQNISKILSANNSITKIKQNCGDSEGESSDTINNVQNCLKISEAKESFNGTHEMDKQLDSHSITKKVSRTCISKKVPTTENFLAEAENISLTPALTSFSFDSDSSYISISSQRTLKQKDSVHSVNSVIEIRDPKITNFNANIINVTVAQISNIPNLNRKSYSVIVPQGEQADFKHSLTSYESDFNQSLTLTSKSFIDDTIRLTNNIISDSSCSDSNFSNETLIPPKTSSGQSRDSFEIGNNLHSHKSNDNIILSCTPKSSFIRQSQDYKSLNDGHINDENYKDFHTRICYDTCMNFNLYPKTRPCSSSVPDFPNNDNVIIVEDMLKNPQQLQKMKNRGDDQYRNVKKDFRASIFQKPFDVVNANDYQKNLNLPNAAEIKTTMIDPSRPERKCSQEVSDYPTSFPELCDKLTIVLEIAVKKLEQTLSEKIVNELKRSLYTFDIKHHSATKLEEDITHDEKKDVKQKSPSKSSTVLHAAPQTNAYLQCDIVQNDVIDKLMLTFNEEYSKNLVQSSSSNYTQKLKKPKLVKNYFDILKNYLSTEYKHEIGKGDSVQISIVDEVEKKIPRFECKKTFWTIPVTILRENILVVASVPAFLFVMFVVYSYIMLLIRMWRY